MHETRRRANETVPGGALRTWMKRHVSSPLFISECVTPAWDLSVLTALAFVRYKHAPIIHSLEKWVSGT